MALTAARRLSARACEERHRDDDEVAQLRPQRLDAVAAATGAGAAAQQRSAVTSAAAAMRRAIARWCVGVGRESEREEPN